MRYLFGLALAIVTLGLVGLGESEAACRVTGEFRVTGPNFSGHARFTETTADASSSSGTVVLNLFSRFVCPTCLIPIHTLNGEYQVVPISWDGSCALLLKVGHPLTSQTANLGGSLAFGGAVILFELYDFTHPSLELNLVLGIRTDFLLKP